MKKILNEYLEETGKTVNINNLTHFEKWLIKNLIEERDTTKLLDDLRDGKIPTIPFKNYIK